MSKILQFFRNAPTIRKIGESLGQPLWNGEAWPGGSGTETDPVFTASPAAGITTEQADDLHAPGSDNQDLSGKVDKATGYSLVADSEISKIHAPDSDNQDLSGKVDKVTGSSLVADTEISKIHAPGSDNQDLSGLEALSLFARVAGSNATTTGQSLVDITGLSVALAANSVYEFEAVLSHGSSSTTGVKVGVNFSAAGAAIEAGLTGGRGSSNTTYSNRLAAFDTASGNEFVMANAVNAIWIRGVVTTGANAGNLTIQHLKVTSGTSTVYINSFLKAMKRA